MAAPWWFGQPAIRALSRDGNKPVAGETATFEVEDGKGNKVFKKAVRTDKFGVAFTEFRLGSILNEGTFKLRVLGLVRCAAPPS